MTKKLKYYLINYQHLTLFYKTFDGRRGEAKLDGVSFVTSGLNTCGAIPISVMCGLGVEGGKGGFIIT